MAGSPKRLIGTIGILISLGVGLIYWPSIRGSFLWLIHRQSSFGDRTIVLPFRWTEKNDEYTRKPTHWIKSSVTIVGSTDSEVTRMPWHVPNAISVDKWREIYGVSESAGGYDNLAIAQLERDGIQCGALRTVANSDNVAIGCLGADQKTTFEYSGPRQDLAGGASIIQQALSLKN